MCGCVYASVYMCTQRSVSASPFPLGNWLHAFFQSARSRGARSANFYFLSGTGDKKITRNRAPRAHAPSVAMLFSRSLSLFPSLSKAREGAFALFPLYLPLSLSPYRRLTYVTYDRVDSCASAQKNSGMNAGLYRRVFQLSRRETRRSARTHAT